MRKVFKLKKYYILIEPYDTNWIIYWGIEIGVNNYVDLTKKL